MCLVNKMFLFGSKCDIFVLCKNEITEKMLGFIINDISL